MRQQIAATPIPPALENFDRLPDSAFVRLPVVAAWRGVSAATVWRHVRIGYLPAPHKVGPKATAWNVGDLRRHSAPAVGDRAAATGER